MSVGLQQVVGEVCRAIQASGPDGLDDTIHEALRLVGENVEASRSSVQVFESFGGHSHAFEWRRPGSEDKPLPELDRDPRIRSRLDGGESFWIPYEKGWLHLTPMMARRQCLGALTLELRSEADDQQSAALSILGIAFTNLFLTRFEAMKAEQRTFEVQTLDRLYDFMEASEDVEGMLAQVCSLCRDAFGCDAVAVVLGQDDGLGVAHGLGLSAERFRSLTHASAEVRERLFLRWQRFAVSTFSAEMNQSPGGSPAPSTGSEVWVSLRGLPNGPAWLILHQSSFDREWTIDERWLLAEVGRRVSDGISNLRSYAEMRAKEERYQSVLRAIPEVVLVFSSDFRLEEICSDPSMSPFHPGPDGVGRPVSELFGEATASLFESTIAMALQSDHVQRVEYTLDWETESAIYSTQARRFGQRGAHRVLWVARDVTDQRSLEEKLLQSQRLESMGRLAGGVAHDFNNILTAILGSLDLASPEISNEQVLEDLAQIGEAADRGARLANQLLMFARKDQATTQLVSVDDTLLRLDQMLRRVLEENVELVTVPDSEDACVLIDPAQLEQVVMNLVLNARDAMPNGGSIHMQSEKIDLNPDEAAVLGMPPGPYLRLLVTDTGTGIPSQHRHQVFDPFFTTKPQGKGTGLGLATCHGIVNQHGGSIDILQTSAMGTSFRVLLPRLQGQPERSVPDMPSDARGTETILLVEDEAIVRDVSRRFLEHMGYRVLQARNGSEALRMAGSFKEPIHLLLTDVVMPQMSGTELSGLLLEARPEMRALFMSGYTKEALTVSERNPKMQFLPKPFRPEELAQKIRSILDA
ncbi:MAG: ATP-binding protein [Myxococcota bacterium]